MILDNIYPFTDPIFKRFFSKKSEIEQSKIVVDVIVSIIEGAVDTKIPMEQLLDELAKRLHHIRKELEAGNCPRDRLNAMEECLYLGRKTLEKMGFATIITLVGENSNNNPNVVKINETWGLLERYRKEEILQMLIDPSDDLAFTTEQLHLLYDEESMEHQYFIVKAKGDLPLQQCVEQLKKMKAFDHICQMIFKIWLPEGKQLPTQELRYFAHQYHGPFLINLPNPLFAVGHDATLKPDEVKLLMIKFDNYNEITPEDFIIEWAKRCESEPISKLMEDFHPYQKILDDAKSDWYDCERTYNEYLDVLIHYCIEDLKYYDRLSWREAQNALNYFLDLGSSVHHALFNFLERAEEHVQQDTQKNHTNAVDFFLRAALWALRKGSLVNWYDNEHHPMDFLLEIKKKARNKTILSLIQKLETQMRAKGAVTTKERENNTDYFKELEYIREESMAEKLRHNPWQSHNDDL